MLLPPWLGDVIASDDGGRAEAEKRRHDVEAADQDHRPDDADARRFGVGHGVEANQDVRQDRRCRRRAPCLTR